MIRGATPWLLGLILSTGMALDAAYADQCPELLDRPWRGITCFHCLHDRSPGGSAPIVDLLKATCLRRVMIAYVIDGSFGWSPGAIEEAVRKLRANGQNVWLHLYVFNGPAQRRWESGVFQSFAIMNPFSFRYAIRQSRRTRAAFRAVVRDRVVPALQTAKALGAKISVAPGLEDNLDDPSFRAAMRLLKSSMPASVAPQYVRNPCFRCQIGNSRALPDGVLYEEHDDQYFNRIWNGIINTDGRYFRFLSENFADPALPDLQDLWLGRAGKQNNAFLLWVPHFQDAPKGAIPRPLSLRHFRGPTAEEHDELVAFLRY